MKRFISYLICALVCITPVFADTSDVDGEISDTQVIKDHGELILCTNRKPRSPFLVKIDDMYYGIDIDIAQYMADQLNVDLKIIFTDSNEEVIDLVSSGNCDVGISKLGLNPTHANKVLFTDNYVTLNQVMVFNRVALEEVKKTGDDNLKNILGKPSRVIGVLKDSIYEPLAKSLFPNATVVSFSSWEDEIVPKLMSGELLVAFFDLWEAYKTLIYTKGASLKLLVVSLKDQIDFIKIAVPMGKFQLRDWINNFLEYGLIYYHFDDLNREDLELQDIIAGEDDGKY